MSVWLTATVTESNINQTNNTSDVTVNLYANWDWGSYNLMNPGGWLSIDGDSQAFNHNFNSNRTQTGSELLVSRTKTVAHNADGSKTVAISAWFDTEVSSGQITLNQTKQLSTIPRASQPTLSKTTFNMGETITISTNRKSTQFTHVLKYSFQGRESGIAQDVATSCQWQVPMTLANQIPNATSAKGTIICETYNSNTGKLIGSKTVEFTAKVPITVIPSWPTFTHTETVSGLAAKFGRYVAGQSKIKVVINNATSQYGATIKGYSTVIAGKTYTEQEFTTDTINAGTSVPIDITVTDSRGRKNSSGVNLQFYEWSAPAITRLNVYRCDANKNFQEDGEYLACDVAFSIVSMDNKNDKSYKLEYRVLGTETWSTALSGSVYSLDTVLITSAIFSVDNGYELRFTVEDYFASAQAFGSIETSFSLVDYHHSGTGLAFGKAAEKENTFECALDAEFSENVAFNGFFTGGSGNLAGTLTVDKINIQTGFEGIQTEWKNVSGLNGWGTYPNYDRARFYKDPFGFVHLEGMMGNGTVTAGTGILTLPQGYRPDNNLRFLQPAGDSSTNLTVQLDVGYNGNVIIKFAPVTIKWISLSGIIFFARA